MDAHRTAAGGPDASRAAVDVDGGAAVRLGAHLHGSDPGGDETIGVLDPTPAQEATVTAARSSSDARALRCSDPVGG